MDPVAVQVEINNFLDHTASNPRRAKRVDTRDTYFEHVGRSYANLAHDRNWRNADGSVYPISVEHLKEYIILKYESSNMKSVLWHVGALKRYQTEVLKFKRWDDVRNHPEIQQLLAELEESEAHKSDDGGITPLGVAQDRGKGKAEDLSLKAKRPVSRFDLSKRPAQTILALLGRTNGEGNESLGNASGSNVAATAAEPRFEQGDSFMEGDDMEEDDTSQRDQINGNIDYRALFQNDSDDSDYIPPSKNTLTDDSGNYMTVKRRKLRSESDSDSSEDGPESFKLRYDTALSILKSKYVNSCTKHLRGCFPIDERRHLLLDEKMIKRWATLIASGDDVIVESPPQFEEFPEFNTDRAVCI
ncbi:1488_t:CDS:2 [Paraglomus brasilianum]|uniref:1488_t:CDS:1 n=1 Tax=Paraglomus brasilianum TaxID=144538 RepID=A0A9N8W1P0_9GLOM|nr:1488_t:CDS:2 [Paraglomus brasilianum]